MTGPEPVRPLPVAVGLVARDGRYLVRQRPVGTPLAGSWEFPGGKCLPGEAPEEAAARECREETGLAVVVGRLRRRLTYHYPHAWVELSFFDCTVAEPAAEPGPGTGFRWVEAKDLPSLAFPEANGAILEELARGAGRDHRA
jgi:8-oxo-dGTP diphosphatase